MFKFFTYGVLAIAALALFLSASPSVTSAASSQYFGFAEAIVVVFFLYMFAKLAVPASMLELNCGCRIPLGQTATCWGVVLKNTNPHAKSALHSSRKCRVCY